MQTFNDKVCLVTGSASGIGKALCEQLAASGARVVATDITPPRLKSAMAPLLDDAGRTSRGHVRKNPDRQPW